MVKISTFSMSYVIDDSLVKTQPSLTYHLRFCFGLEFASTARHTSRFMLYDCTGSWNAPILRSRFLKDIKII